MKLYKITQLFIFLFLCISSKGQVKKNFNNEITIDSNGVFKNSYSQQINYEIPQKNIKELLELDNKFFNENLGTKFNRIATPIAVDLDISKLLNWINKDGISFGKFSIKLNGAFSSSINFDKFYLPKGTEIYIYNENGKIITGPITEEENNNNNIWGSWIYQGEHLNIEIKTPQVTKNKLSLHARNIAYGYKDFYETKKIGRFGQSGTCNIDVICPQGNGWEAERNSIVYCLDGDGTSTFSGTMIMNTCYSVRPYMLTADHNYKLASPAQNSTDWRFAFQVFSPTCSPNQNTDGVVSYTGATLRANWAPSDMCLVELNKIPANNLGIHYAGWTKSSTPALNGTGIHHPRGDVMKISKSNSQLTFASIGISANKHWKVNWIEGVTESGSSGSPLFDQNHRIVGQLDRGPSACGGSELWDFYGRFDISMYGGGTSSTRLIDWLDPASTSFNSTTNTTNIANLIPLNSSLSLSISGDNAVCTTSSSYTVPNLPAGFTVQWSVLPAGIVTINTPNSLQTTLTKITDGTFTLKATVSNCQGSIQMIKPIYVGNPAPTNGVITSYNVLKCTVRGYKYTIPAIGATNYKWYSRNLTLGTPFVLFKNSADNWATRGGDGTCDQTEIKVEVSNACNTTSPETLFIPSDLCPPYLDGSCTYGRSLIVSPNPAVATLQLKFTDDKSVKPAITQPREIKQIRIVDKTGQIKKTIKGNNLEIMNIDISDLPSDVYIMLVSDGKVWISQQINKK